MAFDILAAVVKDETTGGTFIVFADRVPITYGHTVALKRFEFTLVELSLAFEYPDSSWRFDHMQPCKPHMARPRWIKIMYQYYQLPNE